LQKTRLLKTSDYDEMAPQTPRSFVLIANMLYEGKAKSKKQKAND
jgi:hypothetical protein